MNKVKDVLKVAKDKHECPPHHFLIDSDDVGVCRYCDEERDFRKLMGRESKFLGLTAKRGGKRGRRKKKLKEALL